MCNIINENENVFQIFKEETQFPLAKKRGAVKKRKMNTEVMFPSKRFAVILTEECET